MKRLAVVLASVGAVLARRRRTTQPAPVGTWTPARCADWLAGYEWALSHPDDEGVVADRRRLTRGAST